MPALRTFGIDVSHWQGNIKWDSLKNSGVKFSFAKATDMQCPDGTPGKYKDPTFPHNYAGAKSIGAFSGAFHFAREGYSGKDQADFFLSYYTPLRGDLLPSIDVEIEPGDPAGLVTILRDLVAEVSKAIEGKAPIIYTQQSKWEAIGNPKGFEACPLWIIDIHHTDTPAMPPTWADFAFWQYKIDVVPPYHGIEKVDFDYFNGAASDIGKFCY
jgi:lysozyme